MPGNAWNMRLAAAFNYSSHGFCLYRLAIGGAYGIKTDNGRSCTGQLRHKRGVMMCLRPGCPRCLHQFIRCILACTDSRWPVRFLSSQSIQQPFSSCHFLTHHKILPCSETLPSRFFK